MVGVERVWAVLVFSKASPTFCQLLYKAPFKMQGKIFMEVVKACRKIVLKERRGFLKAQEKK